MMRKFVTLIIVGTHFLFFSCKKSEIPTYSGPDGVNFFVPDGKQNAISYSFAMNLKLKERDTLFIPIRTLGAPKNHSRVVKFKKGSNSTARLGIDYELPTFEIAAGVVSTNYPLVIKKSKEMDKAPLLLTLQIDPTGDFAEGVPGDVIGGTTSYNEFKIEISNIIVEPKYWAKESRSIFGRFSAVKFQFMMSVTGLTDFSSDAIGISGQYSLPVKLRNALVDYEKEHGKPLTDEFGQVIF